MKLKKGFVSAGMLYTLLILFLVLTVTMLGTMQNKKTILDKLKAESINAVKCDLNLDFGDALASDIKDGKKALVKGKEVTGSMKYYSDILVNGDNGQFATSSNISNDDITIIFKSKYNGYFNQNTSFKLGEKSDIESMIKSGTKFLGVEGKYTSDANATAADILKGKTAYVNGEKITGTHDGGYKVLTLDGVKATVTDNPKEFKGDWVTLGTNQYSGCKDNGCFAGYKYTKFSIDLGFTPSSISSAYVFLSPSSSKAYPLRYCKYNSETGDAEHCTYFDKLTGIYNNDLDFYGNTSDTSKIDRIKININGSKLEFIVEVHRRSMSNGTSKSGFQTSGTEFYLSGTIIYK